MRIAVEPVLDVLPARWSELCQMACYDLRDPLIEEISTGKSSRGTNFYACSSRGRVRLQADVIVNRIAKTLPAAQVSLRRLN